MQTYKMQIFIYIAKKFSSLLFSLFCVITITFFLMKLLPGDPFSEEQSLPKEIRASLLEHYGLDQPLQTQFFKYIKGVIKGDLGPSYIYQKTSVHSIIKDGITISALIGMQAVLFAFIFGILFGSVAAFSKNYLFNHVVMTTSAITISIPGFFLALLLQYLLSVKIPIFPLARFEGWTHSILPSLILAATPLAYIMRLTKCQVEEILQEYYIKIAYVKGFKGASLFFRHIVSNMIVPVLQYSGPLAAQILTGSFVIEKIFSLPGLGFSLVNSIAYRDYTTVMGITLFYSALLIFFVFLTDLICAWIDPRIIEKKSLA